MNKGKGTNFDDQTGKKKKQMIRVIGTNVDYQNGKKK